MTFNPHRITVTADQTPTVPPPYIPVSGPLPLYSGPPSITKGCWHDCRGCDGTGSKPGSTTGKGEQCPDCKGVGAVWG